MPEISVVIPTCNRRHLLQECLRSLEAQTLPPARFEVVVVDGATDDTIEFLKSYSAPYPLRFLAQENRGLSAARNAGNRAAAADLILCLDDDMLACPELVQAHLQLQRRHPGCLAQGALLVADSVQRTPFISYEARRLRSFHERQSEVPQALCSEDVSGGNSSMDKRLLAEAGGFDEGLRELSDTDGELAYRLERADVPMIYAADALAYMVHIKDLPGRLREAVLYGRTYVYMSGRYPAALWRFSPFLNDRGSLLRSTLRRWLTSGFAGRATHTGLGWLLVRLVGIAETLRIEVLAGALYRLAIECFFWKGVREQAGGALAAYIPRGIPVLCYHNVSHVRRRSFRPYVMPPNRFSRQMRHLQRWGFEVISLDAVVKYVHQGGSLPRRPVAITFDDGYRDLKTTATPLLVKMGYAHTHFVNTAKLGGSTDWVDAAPDLPLFTPQDLQQLVREHGSCVDVQAHGHSHRSLENLDGGEVRREVDDCLAGLAELLGRPMRYMAYPFGDYDERTATIMTELDLDASFTVDQGLCRPGRPRHLLPRIEIFTGDGIIGFAVKLRLGWSPLGSLMRYPFRRKIRGWLRSRPAVQG